LRLRKFPDRASLFSEDFEDLPEAPVMPTQTELYEAACQTILELVRRLNLREMKQAEEALRRARDTGNIRRERLALTRLLRMQPGDADIRAALARLEAEEHEFGINPRAAERKRRTKV
jgi:hypothetical protein